MQGKHFFTGLFTVVLIFLGNAFPAFGQGELYIFGVVKDYANSKKLENVTITAYHNGVKVDEYVTRNNGKYEFFLDLGKEYDIKFGRSGFVGKSVYMDSRNIPEEDVGAGFSLNIEMSLFEEQEGLDVSILDNPIGKAKYNPNTGALEFDFAYTQKIKDEINRLMREWERGNKDKQQADKDKEKELQALEKEFDKLVDQADKAFLNEKYAESVADYKEALKLKEGNPMVLMKLKSAEEKLAEQNAANAEMEKYEAALKSGDDAMRNENYDLAIKKYEEALAIRKDEKYPKDQIADAKARLEAKKKEEEERARFEELVRKGDNLLKAQDYPDAIANYEEALTIKPKDGDVAKKLADAKKAFEEYEKQKAKDEEYNNLVTKADASFKSEAYEQAIKDYEAALKVKSNEKHPAERIELARKKLDEIAKREEEERLEAERQAQFEEWVSKGDAAVGKKDYDQAIGHYDEALKIYADNQGVKKKREDAIAAKDTLEKERELDKEYAAALKEGDDAFKAEQYQQARTAFERAAKLKSDLPYPSQRIKEIDDLLAEMARIEEEKRKEEEARKAEEKRLAEELARFNALVEEGDGFFKKKDYQDAIERYEEALSLKPENQHLPKKIKEAEKLLAELRAAMDAEENYKQAIAEADQKMQAQNFESAIKAYERALEVNPAEKYPSQQIEAAQKMIEDRKRKEELAAQEAAQQAEAASKAAEEAAQAKLREQFNKIVKQGDEQMAEKEYKNAGIRYREALELIADDVEVQKKLADAERLLGEMQSQRDADRQYNMLIAEADAAMKGENYVLATQKYQEALKVKTDDTYSKEQLAEIDRRLKDRDERIKAEEEAAERDRRIKEKEEEKRKKEAALMAEKSAEEEEYNTLIEVADKKFGQSEYKVALRNYKEASALKPGEFYPKSKIQEIERILEEEEERKLAEKHRQEEEMAEDESRRSKSRGKGNTVDSRNEDEAERFMREARLREEAEKYERIKRIKREEKEMHSTLRDKEMEVASSRLDEVETLLAENRERMNRAEQSRERKAIQVKDYKKATDQGWIDQRSKEMERIHRNLQQIDEEIKLIEDLVARNEISHAQRVVDIDQRFTDHHYYLLEKREKENEKSLKSYKRAQEIREEIQQFLEEKATRQENLTAGLMDQKEEFSEQDTRRIMAERERIEQAKIRVKELQQEQDRLSGRSQEVITENQKEITERRTTIQDQQRELATRADQRAQKSREELSKLRAAEPKDYNDYYLSQLAQEYPQGVTEESDNVGNKVIIRRIVVIGNKADEYRKVIDKTGKYYFKNGASITELTWNRETNVQLD